MSVDLDVGKVHLYTKPLAEMEHFLTLCMQATNHTAALAVPVTLSPVEMFLNHRMFLNHITIVAGISMTVYNSLDSLADLIHCVNKETYVLLPQTCFLVF